MRRLCRSQKGQGTLEYLLIVMITVVLIFTTVTQFNQSFRNFAQQIFDGYLACLLETGELPGSGGECDATAQFDSKSGAPYIQGDPINKFGSDNSIGSSHSQASTSSSSGSSGSKSGGSSGSGAKSSGDSSSSSSSKGSSSSSGETAGNGAANSDSSSTAVGSISKGFGSKRSVSVGKADSKDKSAGGKSDAMLGIPVGANGGSDYYDSSGRKKVLMRDFGYDGQEQKEQKGNDRPPTAAMAKQTEGDESLKPKKAIEPERKPAAAVDHSSDEGFSFGYLIKWLLIAGIVLAIIVFFGGQILQASKSWEK
jgi:hypothetical protein